MFALNKTLPSAIFYGNSITAGGSWVSWKRSRKAKMVHILLVGRGGDGGLGAPAGANSTSAGGGGGGSGSQSSVLIPAFLLPQVLCLSLGAAQGIASYVGFEPSTNAQSTLVFANAGGAGGAGSGATAGAAGTAGAAANLSNMVRAGAGAVQLIIGQVGVAGGTTGNASANTAPTSGLIVCSGSGGGGLGAAAAVPGNGGAFTGGGVRPTIPATSGGTATSDGIDGQHGYTFYNGILLPQGGTGGQSGGGTSGNAGSGGNGAPGCGAGGGGGCITGFTRGSGGLGGTSICIITEW